MGNVCFNKHPVQTRNFSYSYSKGSTGFCRGLYLQSREELLMMVDLKKKTIEKLIDFP
jgi:hypothetical protein